MDNKGAKLTRNTPIILNSSHVKFLSGHTAFTTSCLWNPKEDILASGSSDFSTRLWYLRNAHDAPGKVLEKQVKVLKHVFPANMSRASTKEQHEVMTLDWSPDGTKLATGCYDGYARIWSKEGVLQSCLGSHQGPIFAVKWNVTGDYLVTAGVDRKTVVWNADGTKKQEYLVHKISALDVDWVAHDTFASCSTDRKIVVCRVNTTEPIKTLHGHRSEVNAVRYNQHSDRIASCSDDKTVKIWAANDPMPIFSFDDHTLEVQSVKWHPLGQMVASASHDRTVRLFDVSCGRCIKVLSGHTKGVYCVAFSPDGKYLASGCLGGSVFIWHVASGTCVAKYVDNNSKGGIFEVTWNQTGTLLAAAAYDGKIILMDAQKFL